MASSSHFCRSACRRSLAEIKDVAPDRATGSAREVCLAVDDRLVTVQTAVDAVDSVGFVGGPSVLVDDFGGCGCLRCTVFNGYASQTMGGI